MTKTRVKHIIYLDANNIYGHAMPKFCQTGGFKWIDPNEFDLNKYTSNNSNGCALEVDLEYPKELRELRNDYPLVSDKIEIKEKILPKYQILIADFHNISISNVKKLVPNFSDKENYVLHYKNLQLILETRIRTKKIHRVLEFNQSQWLKPYIEFNTPKRIEAEKEKKEDKDVKALYKLMNNAIYGKTMENVRNRINVKLVNNEKSYLECTSKPSYMSHKIFDINCDRKKQNYINN